MRGRLYFFAVLLCLVSWLGKLEEDAPPKRPNLTTEYFTGSGKVERRLGDLNITGTFVIARDAKKVMGVESETFVTPAYTIIDKALLRCDMNQTFYIRGDNVSLRCYKENRNFNGMSNFWAWVDIAIYDGTRVFNKVSYDYWVANVGGVRLELGYPSKENTTTTWFFNRKTIDSFVYYTFEKYDHIKEPDVSNFKIPDFC